MVRVVFRPGRCARFHGPSLPPLARYLAPSATARTIAIDFPAEQVGALPWLRGPASRVWLRVKAVGRGKRRTGKRSAAAGAGRGGSALSVLRSAAPGPYSKKVLAVKCRCNQRAK